MDDILLLNNYIPHRNIMGDGWKEKLCKPISEELVQNWSFNQLSLLSPLINMIIYVGGRGFSE
jgi:hypothetical protein